VSYVAVSPYCQPYTGTIVTKVTVATVGPTPRHMEAESKACHEKATKEWYPCRIYHLMILRLKNPERIVKLQRKVLGMVELVSTFSRAFPTCYACASLERFVKSIL
jgi:hypothetical protein